MCHLHSRVGSQEPLIVYMREFSYYILFGACRDKRNHCETTKDNETFFQEHNLQ